MVAVKALARDFRAQLQARLLQSSGEELATFSWRGNHGRTGTVVSISELYAYPDRLTEWNRALPSRGRGMNEKMSTCFGDPHKTSLLSAWCQPVGWTVRHRKRLLLLTENRGLMWANMFPQNSKAAAAPRRSILAISWSDVIAAAISIDTARSSRGTI